MTSQASAPPPAAGQVGETDAAARVFSLSLVVSGLRCLLTYVVLPWGLPLIGLAKGVGPVVGIAVGALAIVFNVLSIRRFAASNHPWRRPLMALNGVVIVLLLFLLVSDIVELAS